MRSICSLLIVLSFILVGCGGDGNNGGTAGVLNGTFTDSAVDSFSYTTGSVAARTMKKGGKQILNFTLPSVYAAVDETFQCTVGEQIEFSLSAFSNNVDVTTTCSNQSTVETAIRAKLLSAMDGMILEPTVSEALYGPTGGRGNDGFGKLDFSGTGKAFGFYPGIIDDNGIDSNADSNATLHSKIYVVKAKDNCDGLGNHQYDVFIFKDTGLVYNYVLLKGALATALGVGGSIADQGTHAAQCYADGTTDAGSDGLVDKTLANAKLAFRFKDGAIEFDFSGQGVFAESHGENGGRTCSDATIPNSGACESSFEKWEEAN